MADEIVQKFVGNSTDAERAIAQLEARYDKLEAKLKNMRRTSRQAAVEAKQNTESQIESLSALASKYVGVAAATGIVLSGVRSIANAQLQANRNLDAFASKYRESAVKFEVQTGLTGEAGKEARGAVVQALKQTPVTDLNTGIGLQQQLASSGFKPEEIKSGEALGTVLDLAAATNLVGKDMGDPKQAVKALSMTLKGFGKAQPSAADIREFGGTLTELFDTSDIQFNDLKFLAGKGSTLKNFGVDLKTSTAAYASLVDVMGGEKAATGLAGFINRTSTANNIKERVDALQGIGLTPEDVTMTQGGKSFFDVAGTLRTKLKGLPEAKRNEFLSKMYGEEAAPAASFMLSDEGFGLIEKRRKELEQPDIFERNLKTFQESPFARNQRLKIDQESAQMKRVEMQSMTWGEAYQAGATSTDTARLGMDKVPMTNGQRAIGQLGITALDWAGRGTMLGAELLGMSPADIGAGQRFTRNGRDGMANPLGGEQRNRMPGNLAPAPVVVRLEKPAEERDASNRMEVLAQEQNRLVAEQNRLLTKLADQPRTPQQPPQPPRFSRTANAEGGR
ncbi:hypothetical protein GC163_21200 [bacterium]|nr:hypothetical protein [bacterium]